MDPMVDRSLPRGVLRFFTVPGNCGIPATAESVSLNITVVGATGGGQLTFYPGDEAPPNTSTVSFPPSLARANNAVLRMSPNGVLGVKTAVAGGGQVHVVIDVSGYFD